MSATTPPRPLTAGPDAGPSPPFPLRLSGKVIPGFGRGSKELGIPTANIPPPAPTSPVHSALVSGIYYGYASLYHLPTSQSPKSHHHPVEGEVYEAVLSVGYNPFYNNTKRSVEVHLLLPEQGEELSKGKEDTDDSGPHNKMADFYGAWMNLAVLGFVRAERGDYSGVEELVQDIRLDMEVARRSLARMGYRRHKGDEGLRLQPTAEEMRAEEEEAVEGP